MAVLSEKADILNIVDDVTKECLGAIADTSLSGRRVARELTSIVTRRGNGIDRLGQRHRVHLQRDAGLVQGQRHPLALHCAGQANPERLLRKLQRPMRDGFLNEPLFSDLDDTKRKLAAWVADYNGERATPTSSANRPLLHPRHSA
jgi:putative transposase